MAKNKFDFRYQQILDLKEKQEQALAGQVAALDREIALHEVSLDRWDNIRCNTLQRQRDARRRSDLKTDEMCTQYVHHVRRQMIDVRTQMGEIQLQRAQLVVELEELVRSRKILEELRSRDKQRFQAELRKTDQDALDAHSLSKFHRGGESES